MSNNGASFEDYIHYVYSTLLNLKGEKIQVSKRTVFKVSTGEKYEIDIFYEFSNVGVRHRVAIECKNWQRPVDQGKILEFHQKIKNIGEDIVGVFISQSGYQSGAEKVAKRHGILALSKNEIPTIPQILSKHIKTSFIPEDGSSPEPFWYIAELDKKDLEPTGSYYVFPEGSPNNIIPLFISKKHALALLSDLPDKKYWKVYGMPQHKLKGLLAFTIGVNKTFGIVLEYPHENGGISIMKYSPEQLKDEFLMLEMNVPKKSINA